MNQHVHTTIDYLVNRLKEMQSTDGSWRFCFESGPLPDALMIILLRSLKLKDEPLIKELVQKLLYTQEENGAWKLFHDEKEGNLSATVEAYYGLLFSGYVNALDNNMQKAKRFIINHGGITNTNSFTKMMLALTGQIPWPKHLQIPIETILLPHSSPFNLFELVGYARVHLIPILIASNLDFKLQTKQTPNLAELINERYPNDMELHSDEVRFIVSTIKKEINKLFIVPKNIRKLAFKKAEQFLIERIEPAGTLYSYVGATFNMIFAFLALGYPKDHRYIKKAINGIKKQLSHATNYYLMEYCTSTIWDSALITYSLQKAGVPPTDDVITKSINFLMSRQHTKYGDWVLKNPKTLPGGWGFSDLNTIDPDIDDTTATLRALKYPILLQPKYRINWNQGLAWVLSMQNNDGGWAAFEKNTNNKLIALLPFPAADRTFIDPSTVDLTGRTLQFLGDDVNLRLPHIQIDKATKWIIANQEKNGSWYGRWGICYIYGTWAAITGLLASGIEPTHSAITKGNRWLLSIQNDDGGWGESCYSDIQKSYVPLLASTPSQTAWALDAIITSHDKSTKAIEKGIMYLINTITNNNSHWTSHYPTGGGIPSYFYIYYHSYNFIWPLLALCNYRDKFLEGP